MDSITSLDFIGQKKLTVPDARTDCANSECTIDSSVFSRVPFMMPKLKASLLSIEKLGSKKSSPVGSPHLFSTRPVSFRVGPKDDCDFPISLDSSFSEDWLRDSKEEIGQENLKKIESGQELVLNFSGNKPLPVTPRKIYPASDSIHGLRTLKIKSNKESPVCLEKRGVTSKEAVSSRLGTLLNTDMPQTVKLDLATYKELVAGASNPSLSCLKPILSKSPRVGPKRDPSINRQQSESFRKRVSFAKNKLLLVYEKN